MGGERLLYDPWQPPVRGKHPSILNVATVARRFHAPPNHFTDALPRSAVGPDSLDSTGHNCRPPRNLSDANGHRARSSVTELVQIVLIHPEVVPDLVQHRRSDLVDQLVFVLAHLFDVV